MKKCALIAGLVLLALLVIAFTLLLLLTRDEAPPNDADLRLAKRIEIPADENAFTYLQLAIDKLSPVDEETWFRIPHFTAGGNDEENPPKWDAALVNDILTRNAATFAQVERGLACSRIQVPEIKVSSDSFAYLSPWREIVRLMALRSCALSEAGKDREALDETVKIIRFGQLIEQSGGRTLHYLVGNVIKQIGYRFFDIALAKAKLDPQALSDYVSALAPFAENKPALVNSLKMDYAFGSRAMDDVAAGRLGKYDPNLASNGNSLLGHLLVCPNQTRRLLAESYRTILLNADRKPADYQIPVLQRKVDEVQARSIKIGRNAGGIMLGGMLMPGLDMLLKTALYEKAANSLSRLLIAIKCCKLKTGALPASLDALVPGYIDKVPEDPFDGKPMRYDPAKKIIYSIGRDLQDNGGDKDADVAVKIEF